MAITYPTTLDVFTNPTSTSLLTSPDHAQQHSDINDAVEALEAKVAIGNTVLGTYTAYTPTLTNLTIGNGTLASTYCRVNNFIHFQGKITFGSTTSVTGSVQISVPVSISTTQSSQGTALGTNTFYDTSVGTWYLGVASSNVAARFFPGIQYTNGAFAQFGNMDSTTPMTWATGDYYTWNITYRVD